eukprot:11404175-Alexandrium_andersonii.AAC.1
MSGARGDPACLLEGRPRIRWDGPSFVHRRLNRRSRHCRDGPSRTAAAAGIIEQPARHAER